MANAYSPTKRDNRTVVYLVVIVRSLCYVCTLTTFSNAFIEEHGKDGA